MNMKLQMCNRKELLMKCALDIGNSSVKGMLLTDTNEVIRPLRFPSELWCTVADAKVSYVLKFWWCLYSSCRQPFGSYDGYCYGWSSNWHAWLPWIRCYVDTSYKANHEVPLAFIRCSCALVKTMWKNRFGCFGPYCGSYQVYPDWLRLQTSDRWAYCPYLQRRRNTWCCDWLHHGCHWWTKVRSWVSWDSLTRSIKTSVQILMRFTIQ